MALVVPGGAAGSASIQIVVGPRGRPSTAVPSGEPAGGDAGAPGAAVPGSIVHAVSRTVLKDPLSTMSQPETRRPSRVSSAWPAPVKIQGASAADGGSRWPGAAPVAPVVRRR